MATSRKVLGPTRSCLAPFAHSKIQPGPHPESSPHTSCYFGPRDSRPVYARARGPNPGPGKMALR
ncbi:hypothetical protein BDV93DRAFT_517121 [Ceratobasidium sp. AG-I]|nr:hypothetical protein BDV93DRAFT_517121 [Ceratobasidium sp. AG-I]